MKIFYIEESGVYKIRGEIMAFDEDDAIDRVYKRLPPYVDIEPEDRKIEERE